MLVPVMQLSVFAGAALFGVARASLYNETNLNHTCVLDQQVLSCSAGAVPGLVDTCCVETFGGLVLSTQFWDTYTGLESQGQLEPANTWTLHGLWPDFCNGSFTQYCDLSRQFDPAPSPNTTTGTKSGTPVPPYHGPNVTTFIEAFGRYDLLAYMNNFWINQGAPNSDFWAHEFSKHATCYSTFDVPCYGPEYVQHQEVIEFYETAIQYYKGLPSYKWLANAGITPSNTTKYTLSDMQSALTSAFGALPYIGCSGPKYNTTTAGKNSTDNGGTIVDELWYYHHVNGRPQNHNYVVVNATGSVTSCATAKGALTYPEKTLSSVRNVTGP